MQTGIQALDKMISKIGLRTDNCDNEFQRIDRCFGGSQPQLCDKKLPFCIAKAIFQAPMYSRLWLHQIWLAGKEKPLACFLIDEQGVVVERVYYLNARKYYTACDKLINQVQRLYTQQHSKAA